MALVGPGRVKRSGTLRELFCELVSERQRVRLMETLTV
jgi:hypothetical protein